jgi:hypothetical protein
VEISELTINNKCLSVDGTGKPVLVHDCNLNNNHETGVITFYSNGAVIYNNTITCTEIYLGIYAIHHKDSGGLSDYESDSTMGTDDTNG